MEFSCENLLSEVQDTTYQNNEANQKDYLRFIKAEENKISEEVFIRFTQPEYSTNTHLPKGNGNMWNEK